MMEELIRPNVTGDWYHASDAVRILNHAQANYYLSQGVPLLDIYYSRGKTVYVFHKKASFPYFQIWNQRVKPGYTEGGTENNIENNEDVKVEINTEENGNEG